MSYAGLLDGGLRVYIGCGADWTGGTNYSSFVHGLEFETVANGIGGGSFWLEPEDPFDMSAHPHFRHGKRVNVYHVSDAVTTYLYKGFIVNDPSRGATGETKRVTVEMGGPAEVAKYRTDLAFCCTDADPGEWWFENKRNHKAFNCQTGDSIEISVDKGEVIPDNMRGGLISYIPYLGAQYMIGSAANNQLDGVKRIDGYVSASLGDNVQARILLPHTRSAGYDDTRYVNAAYWDTVHTWTASCRNRYFDSNSWDVDWGADGVKHLALALYSKGAAGDNNKMNADRFVRLSSPRVYTGTTAKRIDEGILMIADWVNLHTTSSTEELFSTIPSLVARPYVDPISAINQWSLQAESLVKWGWWPSRSTNNVVFIAEKLMSGEQEIEDSGFCYTVDTEQPGTSWEANTHPEDGQGDVRGVRFIYGRIGRRSDWPAGSPNAVFGPGTGNFKNDQPFLGATANVPTVDFSSRNFTEKHAKIIAETLGESLKEGQPATGTVSSQALTLTRTSDSAAFPWAYLQGGEFLICSQDSSIKPMLITRSHIDVDSQAVSIEVGLPGDALLRQLEQSGSTGRYSGWKKRRK
jgi:hypothetical protein